MNECLIDTDILSYCMKRYPTVTSKITTYSSLEGFAQLNISEITYYEFRTGLEYKQASRQSQLFEAFVEALQMLKVSRDSLDISANRYGVLKRQGMTMSTLALLIAGMVIHPDLTLVTNHILHDQSIPGLQLDN